MKNKLRFTVSALMWAMLLIAVYALAAHAQTGASHNSQTTKKNPAPDTSAGAVIIGTGTPGQLIKWASANSVGDSGVSEDKFGKVGIGTSAPTSKLTVAGMIETTLGGYKFPDGTVQTTAAVGGLQSIFHNTTLTGNGAQGSPLGVAVPLTLSGSSLAQPILNVVNTSADSGSAIFATGGNSLTTTGGSGLLSKGGHYNGPFNGAGGPGVISYGGNPNNGFGGAGLS
jgi:hypothetical protein